MVASPLTLSVITPNYNGANFVSRTINAVMTQSRLPDEYLILDDASTDDSLAEIQRHADQSPRIRVLKNPQNQGVNLACEKLVASCSSQYFYGAAADDYVLPGFFEQAMGMLERHPTAGLCFSDAAWYREGTNESWETRLGWSETPRFFSPAEVANLLKGGWIFGHTSVVRREAFLAAGGFRPELKWHSDWFVNLVLAFRYGVCYLPKPLAVMRVSPSTYSGNSISKTMERREVIGQILDLLASPDYADVRPFFERSAALSHFGSLGYRTILSQSRYWTRGNLRMVRRPIIPRVAKRLRRLKSWSAKRPSSLGGTPNLVTSPTHTVDPMNRSTQ